MRILALSILTVHLLHPSSQAAETMKATVLVRGVHCDACVAVIRKNLASVKGVKLDVSQIQRGEKRRYFSEPLPVEVGTTLDTGIGALAKAAAEAKTPHADDIPPRLNLVLYTEQAINEESVMAMRTALREVNGVLVQESGGLGGFPSRGFYWVRLEPAGGADLRDVFRAAKQAADVTIAPE